MCAWVPRRDGDPGWESILPVEKTFVVVRSPEPCAALISIYAVCKLECNERKDTQGWIAMNPSYAVHIKGSRRVSEAMADMESRLARQSGMRNSSRITT